MLEGIQSAVEGSIVSEDTVSRLRSRLVSQLFDGLKLAFRPISSQSFLYIGKPGQHTRRSRLVVRQSNLRFQLSYPPL